MRPHEIHFGLPDPEIYSEGGNQQDTVASLVASGHGISKRTDRSDLGPTLVAIGVYSSQLLASRNFKEATSANFSCIGTDCSQTFHQPVQAQRDYRRRPRGPPLNERRYRNFKGTLRDSRRGRFAQLSEWADADGGEYALKTQIRYEECLCRGAIHGPLIWTGTRSVRPAHHGVPDKIRQREAVRSRAPAIARTRAQRRSGVDDWTAGSGREGKCWSPRALDAGDSQSLALAPATLDPPRHRTGLEKPPRSLPHKRSPRPKARPPPPARTPPPPQAQEGIGLADDVQDAPPFNSSTQTAQSASTPSSQCSRLCLLEIPPCMLKPVDEPAVRRLDAALAALGTTVIHEPFRVPFPLPVEAGVEPTVVQIADFIAPSGQQVARGRDMAMRTLSTYAYATYITTTDTYPQVDETKQAVIYRQASVAFDGSLSDLPK
ncbi:hypothetical protein DFH06DRAFT_1148497 [Mycena polygramma]|nr:hypothetical protein DFH06DRAFT_1148497 [Mycena polygramma]